MKTLTSIGITALVLAACAGDDEQQATSEQLERRYNELLLAHKISPVENLPIGDALAIYDAVMAAEDGKYIECAQISIDKRSPTTFSVLALNGYGTTSGFSLEVVQDGDGFAITGSSYSPCFYFE